MAVCGNDDKILLFGGVSDYIGETYYWCGKNDTWIYDISEDKWTELYPEENPEVGKQAGKSDLSDFKATVCEIYTDHAILVHSSSYTNTFETWIFDFDDESWTELDPINSPSPTSNGRLAQINNGEILMVGPNSISYSSGSFTTETWIFRESQNTWVELNPANSPKITFNSFDLDWLEDDKVLLYNQEFISGTSTSYLSETWIYDLSDNNWTRIEQDATPHLNNGILISNLESGRILLTECEDGENCETRIFNSSTMSWQTINSTFNPSSRIYSEIVTKSGISYIFSGLPGVPAYTNPDIFNKFNSTTNQWSQITGPTKPEPRVYHKICNIGQDYFLLFSGMKIGYDIFDMYNDTWVYSIRDESWREISTTTSPEVDLWYYDVAYAGDDKALLYGLTAEASSSFQTWIFDLSDEEWTKLDIAELPGIDEFAMSYCGNGKILLFGGDDYDTETPQNLCYIFDVNTLSWSAISPTTIPSARSNHGMTYIGNNRVLLYGGRQTQALLFNDTWMFDSNTNEWTNMNPLVSPPNDIRYRGEFSAINDDMVILYGGLNQSTDCHYSRRCLYVYSIKSNQWFLRDFNPKPQGRIFADMAWNGVDKTFTFGGMSSFLSDYWIFDAFHFAIPTLPEWGLILFSGLLVVFTGWFIWRRF